MTFDNIIKPTQPELTKNTLISWMFTEQWLQLKVNYHNLCHKGKLISFFFFFFHKIEFVSDVDVLNHELNG